jgi:membrane-associated protease RseP (regulator of RpoE activity)
VEKGSRAEKAGFRAGDVIVKINDQPVHDTGDFTHAVKSRTGSAVSVGVIRDKKEQNLNLTLPERKESGILLQEEESLEGPLIGEESAVDLSELQQEVAKLQPQMELAVEDARTPVRELRKDLCGQQKRLRQQTEKLKIHSHLQQEQLKKNQQRLRIELDQLRQLHGFDI